MARILVIHHDAGRLPPSVVSANKAELLRKAGEWLKANPDVQFHGTFVNPQGIGICDWTSPSTAKVVEALKALGAPYDDVVEVAQVLP